MLLNQVLIIENERLLPSESDGAVQKDVYYAVPTWFPD